MKFDDLTHGQTKALVTKLGGADKALAILRGEIEMVEKRLTPPRPLRLLRPTAKCRFAVEETFFGKTAVRIDHRGDSFTAGFRSIVEEPVLEATLVPFDLNQAASDGAIIADLGGEDRAEVALSQVWRLLERQPNGEEGVLLTSGYANIFYVRDIAGALRVVTAVWVALKNGWQVYANSLQGRPRFLDGAWRVFSYSS